MMEFTEKRLLYQGGGLVNKCYINYNKVSSRMGLPMRMPRVPTRGFFYKDFMTQERVVCFVDGFNLYHAINNLKMPYLKWVNLWKLASVFVRPKSQQLQSVYYFSAYAEWLPEAKARHLRYVKALIAEGVTPVMGNFKKKDRDCSKCHHKWKSYEEKETDVNIALALVNLAYQNKYDRALLITNDSDQAPAIRMVRNLFPHKTIATIVPPDYKHSNELIQASSDKAKITKEHLQRCLLPEHVLDAGGNLIVTRPLEYSMNTPALSL